MEEEFINNEDNPGAEAIQLQDFSYREIRDSNPELEGISKREYLNNKELQEQVQGVRLDGTTWMDDFKFEDDLTIGQEVSIKKNKVKETNPIDDSNKFADGGYIDPPKKATRQDSLNVYNNSLKINKYYDSKKYIPAQDADTGRNLRLHQMNDKFADEFKQYTKTKTTTVPSKTNKRIQVRLDYNSYRKDIDENRYQQRELASGILDTRSPMQLFDRRIEPTSIRYLANDKEDDVVFGDMVTIPGYDPISVKPFDLLTEKEKKERVQKYGTSGVPESYYKNKNIKSSEIKKENKPLAKVSLVNKLDPAGILKDDEISSNVNIIPNAQTPKSYKVTEQTEAPYGLGTGNTDITTYEVKDGNNISDKKINGKRTITAQYAEGGLIDPPIKSRGLSPSQRAEAEADATFTNNWNSNRVINGKKIGKGYQIPSDQPVYLQDLNEGKAEGDSITRGSFNKKTNEIFLDPSFDEEWGIPAHEYAHRFQKYTKLQRPKTYNDYILSPISEVVSNQENYETDPDEIHSELMRLRRNANFKPDQVITPQDVDALDMSNYNFQSIKDKDSLIKLLNSTAYNDNSNNINVAAYGGQTENSSERLTSFEGGGTHQQNRLGGIPIGMGSNGKMNTVEEGETRYNFKDGGYVFSNRINTKGLFRDI